MKDIYIFCLHFAISNHFFFLDFSERKAGSAPLVSTSRNKCSPSEALQQPDQSKGVGGGANIQKDCPWVICEKTYVWWRFTKWNCLCINGRIQIDFSVKDPYRVIRSMYCMYDKKLPCILFESIKNTHITASCVFKKMNLLVCSIRLILYSVRLLSFFNVWCLCCKKYSWNTVNKND